MLAIRTGGALWGVSENGARSGFRVETTGCASATATVHATD